MDAIRQRRPPSDASRQRSRTNGGSRRDNKRSSRNTQPNPIHQQQGGRCGRCGKERHPREKCPERDAQCHNCQRIGHYSSQCRQRAVSTVQDGETVDTAFLDTMSTDQNKTWITKITVNGRVITFKLDTGTEVTAISEATWRTLGKPPLGAPNKQLFGPARQALEVMGKFQAYLCYKGREASPQVFVVNNLKTNLLGLPDITALHLAARMESVNTQTTAETTAELIKRKFPKAFQGLGNLGKEYEIKLQPDSKPHALFTPRHVPLPLRPKVAEELDRMEKLGVMSKVTDRTPWCAGMVVVQKKSGNVRICVDLKPLNRRVRREVHPLPKVDETLAQLTGAKIFSKLDANSGFWQIPLAQSSRLLTTFITPMRRYCFNKLPFGISSAPEHFQRRMSELLTGLQGVQCQMDDILVFGKDEAEHDSRLQAVLQRIEDAGVTLNPEKCEFKKKELTFLGHIIDPEGIRADPEKTVAIRKMHPPTSVPELRRFMGMVNQLGKFTPNLAQLTQPFRELLSKSTAWVWDSAQSRAFDQVKEELSKPTTLALYDPKHPRGSRPMHPRMAYSSNSTVRGNQSHSHHGPCRRLSVDTRRLRRRPWLLLGSVRSSSTSYWGNISKLRPTINS